MTFTEPGTYVIRAFADDGIVFEPTDITVAVSGSRQDLRTSQVRHEPGLRGPAYKCGDEP